MDKLSRRTALLAGVATALSPRLLYAAKVPRPAPDLMISRPGGVQHRVSQYHGKILVLELLLTTCPHCQRCAHTVQRVLGDYKDKGVEALGAAINDEARFDLLRFEMASGSRFPMGIADRDRAYAFIEADMSAGPVYFPQLVLIDRQGIIRAQYAGTDKFFEQEESNLRAMLDTLLKPAAPAASAPAKGTKK
ncbi:MAG: redoxin domain-containing protein [Armatimonadia bacterium]